MTLLWSMVTALRLLHALSYQAGPPPPPPPPPLMVYAAELTALSVMPLAYAMALIVVVELAAMGPLYKIPLVSVGVLPSVV
jgi:hypothetical protein